jgi:hypothetical protein
MWAAMGAPTQAAVAVVAATTVAVGGYVHSRRRHRMPAAAECEQAGADGVEPIEFPMR